MASEVIYVTINAPTVESIPTTVGGSPTNVVDVDVVGDYNDLLALVNNAVPTGTIIQGGWTTEPPNFKFLNGQTLVGGVALYPALAAYYPSWVSGANIILPNASGLVMLGTTGVAGTIPISSNSKTVTITANHLPTHTHSVGTLVTATESQGHVHYLNSTAGGWAPTAGSGLQSANHVHSPVYGSISGAVRTGTGGDLGNFGIQNGSFYGFTGTTVHLNAESANHSHALTGYTSGAHQTHTHTISGSTGNNTTTATALPYDTTPAHMLVKFAVKL
jgi:hypothetical protein